MLVTVSTALNAIPAAIAVSTSAPCAFRAKTIAALATPMFPGVSGSVPASSSAGTIRSAAASGREIPKAAHTAVAAATRPTVASPIQPSSSPAARGQRPRAWNASSTWATRPFGWKLRVK